MRYWREGLVWCGPMRYLNESTIAGPQMGDSLTQAALGSRTRPTIVALTGFMGSGKTTVGRALAALLEWEFVDLDELIERRESLAIREIFAQRGEAEFRRIEHILLRDLLNRCARCTVVALGGGALAQANNAELLRERGVRTVFLEVPVEELLRRCAAEEAATGENARPLATDEASFRELYARRLPAYRGAKMVMDAAEKSPGEIARRIAAALHDGGL